MKRRKMLAVYYDYETGELAGIEEAPGFAAENLLLRADVLLDLSDAIGTAYDKAVVAWAATLKSGAKA